jgi:hypothetical protein
MAMKSGISRNVPWSAGFNPKCGRGKAAHSRADKGMNSDQRDYAFSEIGADKRSACGEAINAGREIDLVKR